MDSSPRERTEVLVTAAPGAPALPNGEGRVRAGLWPAVWEASQFIAPDEITALVAGTLAEIASDEP